MVSESTGGIKMKTTILAISMVLVTSLAWAVDVSTVVFTITSSAKTSTANLRITPMSQTMAKDTSKTPLQTFVWRAAMTANYFLTKTKSYTLGTAIGAWIQVDQATNISVNSESPYMTLPAGYDGFISFE
jgi:hypothetical protein